MNDGAAVDNTKHKTFESYDEYRTFCRGLYLKIKEDIQRNRKYRILSEEKARRTYCA